MQKHCKSLLAKSGRETHLDYPCYSRLVSSSNFHNSGWCQSRSFRKCGREEGENRRVSVLSSHKGVLMHLSVLKGFLPRKTFVKSAFKWKNNTLHSSTLQHSLRISKRPSKLTLQFHFSSSCKPHEDNIIPDMKISSFLYNSFGKLCKIFLQVASSLI